MVSVWIWTQRHKKSELPFALVGEHGIDFERTAAAPTPPSVSLQGGIGEAPSLLDAIRSSFCSSQEGCRTLPSGEWVSRQPIGCLEGAGPSTPRRAQSATQSRAKPARHRSDRPEAVSTSWCRHTFKYRYSNRQLLSGCGKASVLEVGYRPADRAHSLKEFWLAPKNDAHWSDLKSKLGRP